MTRFPFRIPLAFFFWLHDVQKYIHTYTKGRLRNFQGVWLGRRGVRRRKERGGEGEGGKGEKGEVLVDCQLKQIYLIALNLKFHHHYSFPLYSSSDFVIAYVVSCFSSF